MVSSWWYFGSIWTALPVLWQLLCIAILFYELGIAGIWGVFLYLCLSSYFRNFGSQHSRVVLSCLWYPISSLLTVPFSWNHDICCPDTLLLLFSGTRFLSLWPSTSTTSIGQFRSAIADLVLKVTVLDIWNSYLASRLAVRELTTIVGGGHFQISAHFLPSYAWYCPHTDSIYHSNCIYSIYSMCSSCLSVFGMIGLLVIEIGIPNFCVYTQKCIFLL